MSQELTFDQAIEILEITDLSKIELNDLPKIIRRAKSRWHPDRVAKFQDASEVEKYTRAFQYIEPAANLIKAYLKGEYNIGEKFEGYREKVYEEPVDIIRNNAARMQETIKGLWDKIKSNKFKYVENEVVLSDGFSLKELLDNDFKEDLVVPALISLIFGPFALIIPIIIAAAINDTLGVIVALFLFIHLIFCVLGFLPLSRFWLPGFIVPIMLWFIDFGVKVYFSLFDKDKSSWANFFLSIPYWIALAIKYLIILPLYGLAKLIIGDKVVGVVKEKVNYYAGFAEWYVNELISKDYKEMNEDELFDLSYLYKDLNRNFS